MGAGGLNFRVRNGNGCGPAAITTGKTNFDSERKGNVGGNVIFCVFARGAIKLEYDQASREISTGRLNTLLCLHLQPINVVVCHDSLGS
jgi:hypothetical protein